MLAAAWLVLFIYAYPGQMSIDSFDQLAEARAGVLTDSHPPALCASGLAIETTLAVLAVSTDLRYSHWLVVSTCLAIVILVARRAAGHARRNSANELV